MVVFNPSKREIGAKIVYYGPAAGGKTTNLQYVHQKLNPNQRGELISLATKDDRTLFFDFLPLDLGSVKGFKTRFHLYTVPGQVYYVSTRRAVLTGVDGVIFVADSQDSKLAENIESLEDLVKNLQYYGKKIEEVPMMLQYNKRDLNDLTPIELLNEKLNKRNLPFLKAVAVSGQGVMETLTMITKAVLENLEDSSRKPRVPSRKRAVGNKPAADTATAVAPPPVPEVPAPQDRSMDSEKGPDDTMDFLPSDESIEADDSFEIDDDFETAGISDSYDHGKDINLPDDSLEFAEMEEDISADPDEPLGFGELGEEAAIDSDEPLEFDDFDEDVVAVEAAAETPSEDEDTLEFGVPDDDLELDLELDAEPEFEPEGLVSADLDEPDRLEDSLHLEEPGPSAHEEVLEDPVSDLEGQLLLKPETEPPEEGPEQESVSAGNGVKIVRCGEAQKLSPSSIRLPLTLKLKESSKEVDLAVTIQIEDLLQR